MKTATANRTLPNDDGTVSKVANTLKRVRVKICGKEPGIIFQGKGLMEEDAGSAKPPRRTPDEEAKLRAHWMGTGRNRTLCIPWVMLYNSFCSAAGSFKYRGSKKMTAVVSATISCETDNITLGTDQYEVFAEYVRIPPRTGALVKIGRPRVREWSAEFVLVVDDELYDVNNLLPIMQHAGNLIGIGAWRPEKRGPYGRFTVAEFQVL